jgi:ribonuclease J
MRHMAEQARFGMSEGVPNAVIQQNGTVIRLAPNGPALVGHERVGRLILDGDVILPADGNTMNERRRIAQNGVVAVTVALDKAGQLRGEAAVAIQGIPVEEDRDDFIAEAQAAAAEAVNGNTRDEARLREAIRLGVRRRATQWTGKKPVVEVSIIRI